MSGRALLALLALLLVAVGYVVFVDRPKVEEEKKKSEALGSLLHAKLEELEALESESGQTTLRLERGATGWRMTRPLAAEADPRAVKSLYDAVADGRVGRVVLEQAADLAQYGLSSPQTRVRGFAKGGASAFEVSIGRASPVGAGRYVSIGDGRVLLVDGLVASTLERKPEEYRERRLVPLDTDDVRGVFVTRNGRKLALSREATSWKLTSPVDDAADTASVDSLTRALGNALLEPATSDEELDKARRGVQGPALTLEVHSASGDSYRALVAAAGPAGKRYACRTTPATESCGTLSETALQDLERDPDEYRDRTLVSANPAEIRGLRVERGQDVVHVLRGEQEQAWSVQEGTGRAQAADPKKVQDLLDRLRWLKASGFASQAAPAVESTIALLGKAGELGKIEVSGEGSKELLVRSSWRPGVLARITPEALGSVPRSASDLAQAPEPSSP